MAVIISPNFVVPVANANVPPFPLTHARIGYQSFCTPTNVTASSEAAGFPAADAVNPFTNEAWQPATLPATWSVDFGTGVDSDYIGIAGHTLHTDKCTAKIEYSTDAVTWTTLKDLSPSDGSPIMLLFNNTTARYWRFSITGLTPPRIAVIFIGKALVMQRAIYGGHSPITLSRRTEITSIESDGGQYMARSIIRKGNAASYEWKYLTAAWYRQYFDPFVKYARRGSFFIAWRPSKFPLEVGYGVSNGDISPSNMGSMDYMQVTLPMTGYTDD